MGRGMRSVLTAFALAVVASMAFAGLAPAQEPQPELLDPDLAVRTAVSGLSQPVSMAFLGGGDMLVIEKASGQVKRVVDGEVRGVALDLAVNFAPSAGCSASPCPRTSARTPGSTCTGPRAAPGPTAPTWTTCGSSVTGWTGSSGTATR